MGERLIRKAVTDSDEDLMDRILRLMEEAARKLDLELDAGQQTQTLQRRIAADLDEAVREAASRRRPMRTAAPSTSPDKRRMPKGQRSDGQSTDGRAGSTDTSQPSADSNLPSGEDESRTTGGEIKETRRAWGHLPAREREEILQGLGEKFLEQYRAWIERYYRALQEPEE